MRSLSLVLVVLGILAACNVSSDGNYSEKTAPLQVAKRYVADVTIALSHTDLSPQWANAEVKSSSEDPSAYAVLVPLGSHSGTYLHVDVFRGKARGALLIGYDATRTRAEIFNLDLHTVAIITNLQTDNRAVNRVDRQSLRILQPVVQAISAADVAPLNPGISALISDTREENTVSILCSAVDAPMYDALLAATDNLNAAVDRMYDALDAYEAAAAAMWSTCSACAAGYAMMCGPCVGLTAAYFAAQRAFYNAVDTVDYWSDRVRYYQEQVGDWVAANC